jgi:predicted ATPase/DNA-binding CsgD family transcriptional regulator
MSSRVLPQPAGPIVGRERELELIEQLLRGDERLLTLTGTGGSGKTFLAIHAISRIVPTTASRVVFVPLGALRDPAEVAAAIARSIGLREAGARGLVQQLLAYLARRPTILVLDNFEQVMPAAPVVAELLAGSPLLQVVATSRSSLRIAGERELPVPPLELPEAVRLLVQRAQAVAPSFELSEENADVLTEICRRLDGLPLAIELAAARTRLLSPEEILERTGRPLNLLTGGRRDAPERQRTLRATIDWSYELLDADEQAVFRSLAVFARGCTLEAVTAVLGAEGESPQLLEELDSLVDQGLARRTAQAGSTRLELLDTIRDYAREKLLDGGEWDERSDRHASYFLELAEGLDPQLALPQRALELLDAEYDNLLAALEYRLQTRDPRALQIALALFPLWSLGGRLSEGRRWSQRVLEGGLAGTDAVRARTLGGAALLALNQADYGVAASLAADALALFRGSDDPRGLAATLRTLAIIARDQGDLAAARSLAGEAVELARSLDEPRDLALALSALGRVEFFAGEFARCTALHEEGRSLLETSGAPRELVAETLFLAWCRWVDGKPSEAADLFERGLLGARAVDDRWHTALALGGLLRVAGAAADRDRMLARGLESLSICVAIDEKFLGAMSLVGLVDQLTPSAQTARLLGAADRLRESVGARWPVMLATEFRHALEAARTTLAPDALTVAFSGGRSLSLEAALHEIEVGAAARTSRADDLTEREVEVLQLVAQGLTNREVAGRLVLSERTVHAHLRTTYRKLGISSRSAATRYALEQGYA